MANIKITDLDAYTNPDSTDVLPIVDVDADTTKRVTIADLMENAGAGTAALPGIAFDGDPNTGIYRPAADQIALSTAGVQRLLIDDNGDVTIPGGLEVQGTTTFINTTNLQVEDKNIELGKVGTPSDTTADGGGITLLGTTNHTIAWSNSGDSWDFSEHVNIASGKEFKINGTSVLSSTTLGSGVTASSLTSVGTITTGVWNGTALTSSAIGTGAITTAKIADDAVDADKLANTTVTAGSYTAADITVDAQGRITAAANGTLGTAEIANGAVTTEKIADDAVNADKLANTAVTAGSYTAANITVDAQGRITSAADGTASVADGSITNVKVSATAAIAGTKIDPDFGAQDLTVDTDVLHVDATNDRVGVGTSSPSAPLHVSQNEAQIALFQRPSGATNFTVKSSATTTLKIDGTDGVLAFVNAGGATPAYTIGRDNTDNTLRISQNSSGPGTNDLVTINSSGNVGVGTTSPGSYNSNFDDLVVANSGNGGITIATGTSSNGVLAFADGTTGNQAYRGWVQYLHSIDNLVFGSAGSERVHIDSTGKLIHIGGGGSYTTPAVQFNGSAPSNSLVIDSAGRVGIGTSSPSQLLDLKGSSASLALTTAGASDTSQIYWRDSDDAIQGYLRYDHSGESLAFAVNGASEKMRIDSNGNVGIGDSSLDSLSARTSIGYRSLRVQNANITAAGGSYAMFGVNYYQHTDGVVKYIDAGYSGRIETWGDYIAFHLSNGAAADDNISSSERMRIDSSGRLLLGTTTEGHASAENLTIANSGDVGITLRSTTSNQTQISFSDGTTGADEYRGQIAYDHTDDHMRFRTNAVERLRINSNGAWGIEGASNYGTSGQVLTSNGNDSPTWQDAAGGKLLQVVGTLKTNGFTNTGSGYVDITGLSQSITVSANSRVMITGHVHTTANAWNEGGVVIRILRGTTAVGSSTITPTNGAAGHAGGWDWSGSESYTLRSVYNMPISFVDTALSAGTYTYKVQIRNKGSNNRIQVNSGPYGDTTPEICMTSALYLMEIGA